MTQDMTTTIKGVTVSDALLVTALGSLPLSFSKGDFAQALNQEGLPEASDGDLVRRLMQSLKRQGIMAFADDAGTWSLTPLGLMRLPSRTLPLTAIDPPLADSAGTNPDSISPVAETLRQLFSALACIVLVGALIGLNASFAWELGIERLQFQLLITAGLMAVDMMRPGFVLMGFYYLRTGYRGTGVVALTVALILSPLSVMSTSSILSASLLLGSELNHDAQVIEETRQALRAEHARLLARAAQDEAAWRQECARGGCGRIARELETAFQQTVAEAQAVLDQIVALSDDVQGTSELLSRLVTTFEGLGLFGSGRELLLPLFLAISLELGALFGPALLMRRRA